MKNVISDNNDFTCPYCGEHYRVQNTANLEDGEITRETCSGEDGCGKTFEVKWHFDD